METNEPFVIVWRAQAQTPAQVRNECFKRIRVHHPNALVFVVWERDVSDFSFVDERCRVCEHVCQSDLDAWRMFYEARVGDSGLLLRDNLFVGSKPFPPFLHNQFLWCLGTASFGLRSGDATKQVVLKLHEGLLGYLRRSCMNAQLFRGMSENLFLYNLYERYSNISTTFPDDATVPSRSLSQLNALIDLDVPVYCFIK